MGCRHAAHLISLAELWLAYWGGDPVAARLHSPHLLPPGPSSTPEFRKALKTSLDGCDMWRKPKAPPKSRFRQLQGGWKHTPAPPHDPAWGRRLTWELAFNQVISGAVRRGIDDTLAVLPKENRKRIRRLL